MDILFDLDGTLVDPKPGIIASFRHALSGLGLSEPPECELLDVIGPPLRESFPRHGVAAGDVERALTLYRTAYAGSAETGPPAMYDADVYPGVESALEGLRRAGCRLIVATSKPHVFARPILRQKQLEHYFAAIHGAELDGRNDDKGHLIAHILAQEGVEPAEAIMVGDRRFDVTGARRNGIKAIGVCWGYGSIAELQDAGATALCPEPGGLHTLALRLLTGQG